MKKNVKTIGIFPVWVKKKGNAKEKKHKGRENLRPNWTKNGKISARMSDKTLAFPKKIEKGRGEA
jgi:hypothetical protein